MKIRFLACGRNNEEWIEQGSQKYIHRIGQYVPFEAICVPDLKNTGKMQPEELKKREAQQLLRYIAKDDVVILLDERGRQFSSIEFSQYIEKQMIASVKQVVFVVGGPYGFAPEMKQIARMQFSLSSMTFSHQIVRLLFLEQLYRALTIIRGEPYHHA